MSASLLAKLHAASSATPNLSFGQLVEAVEDIAWDLCPQRAHSPRMMHMPDHLFEAALMQWVNVPLLRKTPA